MSYHWKAHVFTFPPIPNSLQSHHFERSDDHGLPWLQINLTECVILSAHHNSIPKQVEKLLFIHLYFKDSVLNVTSLEQGRGFNL